MITYSDYINPHNITPQQESKMESERAEDIYESAKSDTSKFTELLEDAGITIDFVLDDHCTDMYKWAMMRAIDTLYKKRVVYYIERTML